jgi:hypothetical protein
MRHKVFKTRVADFCAGIICSHLTPICTRKSLHTAKTQYRKFETRIPRKGLRGHSPNFHIHVSVSDLNIPTIDLPILLQENMWTDPGHI